MIGCDGRTVSVGDAVMTDWRADAPTHRVVEIVDGPGGFVFCADGRVVPAGIFEMCWRRLGWSEACDSGLTSEASDGLR